MSSAWLNRGSVAAATGDASQVPADFVLSSLEELPAVVEAWLARSPGD